MSSRRRKNNSIPIVILAILLCIFASTAVVVSFSVLDQANRNFPDASDDLSDQQRMILAVQLYLNRDVLFTPVDTTGDQIDFSIASGESVQLIAERLEDAGIIPDGKAFQKYLIYKGYDRTIQAGEFLLSPSKSAIDIAEVLQQSSNARIKLTIFAGWRLEEVAAAVAKSGLNIKEQEFIYQATNGASKHLPDSVVDFMSLEGLLFPGIYTVERTITADNLIQEMVGRSSEKLTPDILAEFSERNLSLQEAITLASIVEREAIVESEMTQIASVFHNRLQVGMRLESDPTVQYALGYNSIQNTWWTNPLSLDDLLIASPYNSYQNVGLPPGPICNPGASAIEAVARPAETDYFFFRASCDGSGTHQFALTYDEHLLNACP